MCGIAGYIGSREIPQTNIQACLREMYRRGPDFAAYYKHDITPKRHVILLNTRLSIIDLEERSNPPFHIGSTVMVYNGELYNYLELKQELAREVTFHTESDTEVLLQTLIRHGWQGLDRCEGMWAFVVFDEKEGTLLMVRDRFGEKPLYLHRDESGLYFGSEVKFIFTLLGRKLAINYNHLYRYMVNGYKALYKGKETFFEGIEDLPQATVLAIDREGKEKHWHYWKPELAEDRNMTFEEALKGTREALIKSVQLRLRADVPLAFCMSGGIDSNSLISIAKRVFDYDVHGFTIVNTDVRYEEQDMVEHSIKSLGIRHTSILVDTTGFLSKLRTLVCQHDAPVYTINYFAHWLLMENIAAHGYKISISGTAADELFSGYYDHHLQYLYEIRNDPALFGQSVENWKKYIHPIVRNPHLQSPNVFIDNPNMREHIYMEAADFATYLHNPWSEAFDEEVYCGSLMRNRMLNELFHEAVVLILHEDDINAMYYSIENRSPYLDRALFDFTMRIPTRYLVQNGAAKAVLRKAMRGIVPDAILDNRRKVGFNAPIFSYLDVHDVAVRAEVSKDSPIYDHVKREKIQTLMDRPDLPNSESKFLFYFLTSKMFLEEFGT